LGTATAFTKSDETEHFLSFCKHIDPTFQTPAHIRLIAKYLEAVERGDIKRLMIFAPPRHGKSQTTGQFFPAWFIGRNPKRKVIIASYGADLAERNSRKARDMLVHPLWPFTNCKLSMKSQSVAYWQTDAGGEMLATGVGGRITGFGADLLIIDDPVKGEEEADSPLMRDKTFTWYTDDARSRMESGGRIIVIQTRWHEDDLSGRILAQEQGWTVLNLPAIAEDDGDLMGRKVGEALWPEHIPIEELPDPRKGYPIRSWNSLYQQRPTSEQGNMFHKEWWKYYDQNELDIKPTLITVDSAFKDGVQNDYSVAAVWGRVNGAAYLIDIWRERVQFPELCAKLRELYKRYRCTIVIEDKASGQSLVQVLSRPLADQPAIPVIAYKLPPRQSKSQRAEVVTRYVEGGLVYLPGTRRADKSIEPLPFVKEFMDEHSAFPSGKYDDQVDTTAIALRRIFETPDRGEAREIRYNKKKEKEPGAKWINAMREARHKQAEEYWAAVLDNK
jgi:predicted phage terminase large subunit-like protein